MMLSKPEQTEDGVKPKALDAEKKAQEVADLERRLADLSTASIAQPPAAAPAPVMDPFAPKPAMAPAPASKTSAAGGKSALLARIMAAQERAKQSQPGVNNQSSAPGQPPAFAAAPPAFAAPPAMDLKPPPPAFSAPPPPSFGSPPAPAFSMAPPASSGSPPSMDLLFMDSPAPAAAAPPAFDQTFLPPPSAAAPPPAFDAMSLPNSSQAPPAMQFDPMAALAPPSAPMFEDLMMDSSPPAAAMPPPMQPPPPQEESGGLDEETIQAIMAMDGMSEADKQSMIDEQLKIMKSIESKKKPPQVSAADAFEQRSFSAAVQAAGRSSAVQTQGQERTEAAIQDGTAVMVQCTSCENWMQVTGAAQLMFCPVCQTVTPVVRADGGAMPEEDASQMAADLRLAEQLQKEEYAAADQTAARRSRPSAASQAAANSSSSSWMGWLGFGSPAPAPAPEEEVSFSRSGESLQGGQTASQAPMFACVTDSINNAANYAMSLQEDEEGNVHGVDASSLLAVPQVGRNTDQSNN